ncbi:MAG: SGNH/GDSL hydrolase family protein [Lachnospiraceae bacterium]|nr:SGNH/GDSL hydrolase family protein [Lachnospiraceae bacterium]
MNKGKIFKYTAVALIVCVILFLLQRLTMPKYTEGIVEGAFIAEYYREPAKDFDVIFVGDCEVYENFSPVELWNEYGIHSYIRGSAQQLIWQSYYLLEDTLRYETPKAVVFNIQSLQYDTPQSEAYNRMTLDGMKWSPVKVKDIIASMTEEENFIEYVFPILRYHSRITELTADDVKYMFKAKPASFNGYFMRVDTKPAENVPEGRPLPSYDFGEHAWEYLDKMRELCAENGIDLILIKAPSLHPYWYPEYDSQVREYADRYGLTYINFYDVAEDIGIDYSTDTYDAGLHMNLSGAKKLSHYFGGILAERGIPDRRDDEELKKIYEDENRRYEAEILSQKEKYGIE